MQFNAKIVAVFFLVSGILLGTVQNVKAENNSYTEGLLTYSLETGAMQASVIGCNAAATEVTIPQQITYNGSQYTVVDIETNAFANCAALKKVSMADTITQIHTEAFYNCEKLEEVKLSENLQMIYRMAFSSCDLLKTIDIPEGVTYIGSSAFSSCESLSEIHIPDTVTEIGASAFAYTGIKKIKLSNSLQCISNKMFLGCSLLESVEIPKGVTQVEDEVFIHCPKLVRVVFPPALQSIGENLFYMSENRELTIFFAKGTGELFPYYEGINEIQYEINADDTVSLLLYDQRSGADITLPGSLYGMTIASFEADYTYKVDIICTEHKITNRKVTIEGCGGICAVCGKSVSSVHDFGNGHTACECGYIPFTLVVSKKSEVLKYGYSESATISVKATPKLGKESISYQWYENGKAISGAKLGSYDVPKGKQVGTYIYSCIVSCGTYNIESDKITVKVIPLQKGDRFKDKKTNAVYKVIKSGTKPEVSYEKPIKKKKVITIPATVTYGGDKYKVTQISANACKNNKKLKTLLIGKNVKKIGSKAFYNCKNLKKITIKTKNLKAKKIGKNAFNRINNHVKIKVPKSKLKVYKEMLYKRGISRAASIKK